MLAEEFLYSSVLMIDISQVAGPPMPRQYMQEVVLLQAGHALQLHRQAEPIVLGEHAQLVRSLLVRSQVVTCEGNG